MSFQVTIDLKFLAGLTLVGVSIGVSTLYCFLSAMGRSGTSSSGEMESNLLFGSLCLNGIVSGILLLTHTYGWSILFLPFAHAALIYLFVFGNRSRLQRRGPAAG